MQGRGNSGILEVKQCSVRKMTLCGPSLLIHSALPLLSREIPPRAGGQVWRGGIAGGLSTHLESHTFSLVLSLNSEADSLHDPCRQTTSLC